MTSEAPAQDSKPGSRFEKTFNGLMGALEAEYRLLRPEFDAGRFRQRVFERLDKQLRTDSTRIIDSADQIDKQALNEFVQAVELDDLPVRTVVWSIYEGCAYCVMAGLAYKQDDRELAWVWVTRAAVCLGTILTLKLGPDVYDHELKKALQSKAGRNAAKGRHKDTEAMKQAAYSYVRESGGFPSQSKATIAIEGFFRTQFPAKALKDPEATIARWLRDMPEREKYFVTVKKSAQ